MKFGWKKKHVVMKGSVWNSEWEHQKNQNNGFDYREGRKMKRIMSMWVFECCERGKHSHGMSHP